MDEQFFTDVKMDQQVEARIAVECAIAWLAARKADAPHKTQLCEAFTQMAQLEMAGTVDQRQEADIRFHRLLADIADNPVLSRISSTLMELISEEDNQAIYRMQNVPARSDDQHWNIVVAVCANNPEAAEQAMKVHMQFVYGVTLLDDI